MVANSMTKQITSSYRAIVAVGHKETVTMDLINYP